MNVNQVNSLNAHFKITISLQKRFFWAYHNMLSLSPSMYFSPYFNSEYSSEDPSIKCLSIVLSLGRIFGVIPHSRTWTWFQRDSLRFKLYSLSGFYVLVLSISSFIYYVPLVYILEFGENTDNWWYCQQKGKAGRGYPCTQSTKYLCSNSTSRIHFRSF